VLGVLAGIALLAVRKCRYPVSSRFPRGASLPACAPLSALRFPIAICDILIPADRDGLSAEIRPAREPTGPGRRPPLFPDPRRRPARSPSRRVKTRQDRRFPLHGVSGRTSPSSAWCGVPPRGLAPLVPIERPEARARRLDTRASRRRQSTPGSTGPDRLRRVCPLQAVSMSSPIRTTPWPHSGQRHFVFSPSASRVLAVR